MVGNALQFFLILMVGIRMSIQQPVAVTPADRLNEDWWKQRHEQSVEVTKAGGIDLVFLGDSITQGWEGGGKSAWDRDFAPLRPANFGFSGDRTEHVLWRLANGEIVGLNPKLIVIMLGTNNMGHGSSNPTQTAEGMKAILQVLRTKLPASKILLLGIFPRGKESTDSLRTQVAEANARYQLLADGKSIEFLDIGKHFVRIDGTLRDRLMPDFLHLNQGGYDIWAKAILPTVKRMLDVEVQLK